MPNRKYTFDNNHPQMILAGERKIAKAKTDFEHKSSQKHSFAIVQAFLDFIGHEQVYDRAYFDQLKSITDLEDCTFYTTENVVPKKYAKITVIRPLLKYVQIEFKIIEDGELLHDEYVTMKIRYDIYQKVRNSISKVFFDAVVEPGLIHDNFADFDNTKDIWKFDFSKISFKKEA